MRVVQSKPPASWIGTVAEEQVQAVADWDAHGPLTIFEGVAREAAAAFPKSSNVTATLALATVGLDATQVRLVVEDHVKAEGNSEKFAGNPCAYQVHLYRRGVRLSAGRRAAAKRVRRSSGRLAQSPRNQHWPR